MAQAKDFSGEGFNQDLVINNYFDLAAATIYSDYGHRVKINRKVLHKYGRAEAVGTTEVSVNILSRDEVFATDNDIDTISSTDATDTQTIRIEGMTLEPDGSMEFNVQTAALNGQNKVVLGTPLYRVTRMTNASVAATAGNVYVYEDTTITAGVPNDLDFWHATLDQSSQTTLKVGTSVAGNNYFVMTRWDAFINRQQNAAVDFRLKYNTHGYHLPTRQYMSARNTAAQATLEFKPFLVVPPNYDIVVKAVSTAASTAVNSNFYGFFADIVT